MFRREFFWVGWLLLIKKVYWRIVSKVYARALHADGLKVNAYINVIGSRDISFGRNIFINGQAWIECVSSYGGKAFSPVINIGDGVCFSDRVHISAAKRIDIGKGVLFGSNIYVSDNSHGAYDLEKSSSPEEPPAMRALQESGEVHIEDNVWIGDNCVIMAPARIGRGSVIGANSLIKGNVPPNEIWAGTPAKKIKYYDQVARKWVRVK